jgi:hypothetical protein
MAASRAARDLSVMQETDEAKTQNATDLERISRVLVRLCHVDTRASPRREMNARGRSANMHDHVTSSRKLCLFKRAI